MTEWQPILKRMSNGTSNPSPTPGSEVTHKYCWRHNFLGNIFHKLQEQLKDDQTPKKRTD
jgi:hypothetical protein